MEFLTIVLAGAAAAALAAAVARGIYGSRLRILRSLRSATTRAEPPPMEQARGPGGRGLGASSGSGLRSLRHALQVAGGFLRQAPFRRWAERQLRGTGLPLRPEEFLSLCVFGVLAGLLLAGLLPLASAVRAMVFLAPSVAAPLYVRAVRARRSARISGQLGETLLTLSNGLRAGHSLPQALAAAAEQTGPPLGEEFSRLLRETSAGIPMEEGLARLVLRAANPDVELLVTAVLVQREVGGNLAEILDKISGTIRSRVAVQNHLRVVTAQSRMSGWVVGLLPVGVFGVISLLAPEIESVLTSNPFGRLMALAAVVLEAAGLLVIRSIVSIRY